MQLFLKLFGPYLQWVYHCFDRIVINGHQSVFAAVDGRPAAADPLGGLWPQGKRPFCPFFSASLRLRVSALKAH